MLPVARFMIQLVSKSSRAEFIFLQIDFVAVMSMKIAGDELLKAAWLPLDDHAMPDRENPVVCVKLPGLCK